MREAKALCIEKVERCKTHDILLYNGNNVIINIISHFTLPPASGFPIRARAPFRALHNGVSSNTREGSVWDAEILSRGATRRKPNWVYPRRLPLLLCNPCYSKWEDLKKQSERAPNTHPAAGLLVRENQ